MIVKTFKVRKKGLVICGGILIALLVILVVFGIVHKATAKTYPMKTESERQKFMSDMGWEVSEEYTSCKVVSIPEEFNDTYESYNELQKEQGFNLKKYKGEMVEIYTYAVYNYPGNSENVVINLMVFDGNLIGGDVSCNELDGFMQGLKNPDPDNSKALDEKDSDEEIAPEESDASESSATEQDKKNNSSSNEKESKSDKKQAKNTFDSSVEDESSADSDSAEATSNVSDSAQSEESSTASSEENTSATDSSEQQW